MRGFKMSLVSLILWGWLLQSAAAWKEKRNAIPKFMFDPATPKSCAWWLDVDGPWTCEGIEQVFEVSPVDFLRWNPSVTTPCGDLPVNQSYCLATNEGWRSPSVGPTTVSVTVPTTVFVPTTVSVTVSATVSLRTTVSVSTTVMAPTTVSVTVPVTVPVTTPTTITKTLPVTVAVTVSKTVSVTVPVTVRVTSVITSTVRTTATSTVTAAGGPTPQPSQPGMVGNCKAFYFVQWGDTCDSIAARFGIRSDQIVSWNPQARSDCTRLLAETYCCVWAY